MKKVWSVPEVQELTIQATAHRCGGHFQGHGDRDYGHKNDDNCTGAPEGNSPIHRHPELWPGNDDGDELS